MSRGYRCFLVGIVGWLVLANAGVESRPPKTVPSAETTKKVAPTPTPAATSTPQPYKPYPTIADPHCYDQSEDHDRADLCAQWRAAFAAERAAKAGEDGWWISAISAGLTLISIFLVLIALRQTREANRIARETGQKQLRAYISVITIDTHDVEFGHARGWRITVRWKNSGQTPADHAYSFINTEMRPEKLPSNFSFPPTVDSIESGVSVVGPGGEIYGIAEDTLFMSALPALAVGQMHFYIWGAVDYRDYLGELRRTEWAAKLIVDAVLGSTHGVRWESLDRHNSMDGDCMKKPYADRPEHRPKPAEVL